MNEICNGPECIRPVYSLGLCSTHYMQQWLGKPLTPIVKRSEYMRDIRTSAGRACTECGVWKEWDEFYALSGTSRWRSKCKVCERKAALERHYARKARGV